jgi:hypothetical protein
MRAELIQVPHDTAICSGDTPMPSGISDTNAEAEQMQLALLR